MAFTKGDPDLLSTPAIPCFHATPAARRRLSLPSLKRSSNDHDGNPDGSQDVFRKHGYRSTWLDHSIQIPISSSPVPTPSELSFASTSGDGDNDVNYLYLKSDIATGDNPTLENVLSLTHMKSVFTERVGAFDAEQSHQAQSLTGVNDVEGREHESLDIVTYPGIATRDFGAMCTTIADSAMKSDELAEYSSPEMHEHIKYRRLQPEPLSPAPLGGGDLHHLPLQNTPRHALRAEWCTDPFSHLEETCDSRSADLESADRTALAADTQRILDDFSVANIIRRNQALLKSIKQQHEGLFKQDALHNSMPELYPSYKPTSTYPGDGYLDHLNYDAKYDAKFDPSSMSNNRNGLGGSFYSHVPTPLSMTMNTTYNSFNQPSSQCLGIGRACPTSSQSNFRGLLNNPPRQDSSLTQFKSGVYSDNSRPSDSDITRHTIERHLSEQTRLRESTPAYEDRSASPSPISPSSRRMSVMDLAQAGNNSHTSSPAEAPSEPVNHTNSSEELIESIDFSPSSDHLLSPTHSLQVHISASPSPLKLSYAFDNGFESESLWSPSQFRIPTPPPIPGDLLPIKLKKRLDRRKSGVHAKGKSERGRSVTAGNIDRTAAISKQQARRAHSRKATHGRQWVTTDTPGLATDEAKSHRRSARLQAKVSGVCGAALPDTDWGG